MGRLSTIAFVGMLALTVTGCGSQSQVTSVSAPSAPPVLKKQPAAQPFEKPQMVTQQPTDVVPSESAAGLIQPTNPQERIKQVEKGRKDPFALLPGQAVAIVPTTPIPQTNVSRLPSFALAAAPRRQDVKITHPNRVAIPPSSPSKIVVQKPRAVTKTNPGSIAQKPIIPKIGAGLPPVIPGSPLPPVLPPAPSLPPPPQTDLASSVTVTGVVQVGDEIEAIVKVPNEATSRYVRMGQQLSNGQVLVKRIEINQGSDPVVILEQNGVEVTRAVGDKPASQLKAGTSGTSETSAAIIPVPSRQ